MIETTEYGYFLIRRPVSIWSKEYDQICNWCNTQNLRRLIDWGMWYEGPEGPDGIWFADQSTAIWFALNM